ncbi:MAG: hypothetical protein COW01_07510 [Bdellovibrionales bacterium CG12_big_fil_rev_8_21_14_0_65_38_15]|nr:MAG: hypothetical protein COW79_04915 [Bdellovibrionales bacterium CG22_combo_CG10-13_8_21_14_all_38_13]PIQ55403.1 MAG: hypothetical protein COW01_07510 [Bdellovibrionales bacterium CG12_big_fil_rev_8_21_14_0_65_38_15]PIR28765.1 MAG: hypothetical protein COV38_14120 [Bdellovibrionales bacterium CG11_big_fil_rev_8_21_14_0_20_38_13]
MEIEKKVKGKGESKEVVRSTVIKQRVVDDLQTIDPNKELMGTKRGRKTNEKKKLADLEKRKSFTVFFKNNEEKRQKLLSLLRQANDQNFGDPIEFEDLVYYFLETVTAKDLEKIRDNSLDIKAKVLREFVKQNEKKGENIDFWEYVAGSLKIS